MSLRDRQTWYWIGGSMVMAVVLTIIIVWLTRKGLSQREPWMIDPADLDGEDDEYLGTTPTQPLLPADAGGTQDPPPWTGGQVTTVPDVEWYRQFRLSNGDIMVLPDIVRPLADLPPGQALIPWENLARNMETRVVLDRGPGNYEGNTEAMRALYEGRTMPKVRYISIPFRINWQDAFNWGRPGEQIPPAPIGLGTGWTERQVHILYAEHCIKGILGQYRLTLNAVQEPSPFASSREIAGYGAGMSFSPDYRGWYYGDYYTSGIWRMTDVQRIEHGWGALQFGPRQAERLHVTPAPADVRIQVGETAIPYGRDADGREIYLADYVIHWNLDGRYRFGLPLINADGYYDVGRRDQGWLEVLGIYYTCIFPWSMALVNPQQSTIILLRQLTTLFNQVWGPHIWGYLANYKSLASAWHDLGLPTWGILEPMRDLEHEADYEAFR